MHQQILDLLKARLSVHVLVHEAVSVDHVISKEPFGTSRVVPPAK